MSVLPVGVQDIAERLGVSAEEVHRWRDLSIFPPPRWRVSGRPAWNWEVVEKWAIKMGYLEGKE